MDFKLYVFKTVCEELSFSKAAERVNISQPAVSKNIKALEEYYACSFFIRKGSKIQLSPQGEYLYGKSKQILNQYGQIEDHFRALNHKAPDSLKIGCSTTLSQYLLPSLLIDLQNKYPELTLELTDGNSRAIEKLILDQVLDFGIVEGNHHLKDLKYQLFVKDEIVLIHKASTSHDPRDMTLEDLKTLSIIRREIGSGTDEIVESTLSKSGYALDAKSMRIGSTQAIKSMVLQNPDLYAFVSVHSINEELRDSKLEIIDVEGLEISRDFNFITRQGNQSQFFEGVQRELIKHYNQKL